MASPNRCFLDTITTAIIDMGRHLTVVKFSIAKHTAGSQKEHKLKHSEEMMAYN